MKRPITLTDRIRYAFDNTMSRGAAALIAWLAMVSMTIVATAGAIISIGNIKPDGRDPLDFLEATWEAMMRTLDAGTMGGDTGWGFRFVMFLVTLAGVFVISTLIGVITAGVDSRIAQLRKGRSRVVESGHTVILGWSPQVFVILEELVQAHRRGPRTCIVVLGERDKVAMEDEIRERIPDAGKTRIVCRTGDPANMEDLEMVSIRTSKSIILLSPDHRDPDSSVIKAILAITNHGERDDRPHHVVAEIRDPRNVSVAHIVGKEQVEVVLVGDLVARLVAQTCRQSGLSIVYNELLDFKGDAIYFLDAARFVGRTFGETLAAFQNATVLGLKTAAEAPCLNPPMATPIAADDQLVCICKDPTKLEIPDHSLTRLAQQEQIRSGDSAAAKPERTLILGWNWRVPKIIRELDNYVLQGSEVLVVADFPTGESMLAREQEHFRNQQVRYQCDDTTDRKVLDSLEATGYDHIIILCYSESLDAQQADSRTLVTLLHLRDIAERAGVDLSITSEMLDMRNCSLAEVARADDFIVSDRVVSLVIAQVAENKSLNAVFADLFTHEGSEIYFKPVQDYVVLQQAVNFATVLEAARLRDEVAIGYRLLRHAKEPGPSRNYGVVLNPDKSDAIVFEEGDRVVVLAES